MDMTNTQFGIAAGLPIVGGLMSALGQDAANNTNKEIANDNRLFQLNMSNTAYQRATADMSKAGINPMLAYMQGGASTGQGSSASAGNSMSGMADAMSNSGKMIQQNPLMQSQKDAADSQVEANEAAAGADEARADLTNSQKKSQDIDNYIKDKTKENTISAAYGHQAGWSAIGDWKRGIMSGSGKGAATDAAGKPRGKSIER